MSEVSVPTTAASTSSRIAYVPALDGLRAICILGVLLFHAGFDEVRGGFLGVSMFFTLSGYLVTSILLAELDGQREAGVARPRVAFVDFFRRRLRRLVPASIVTLLAIVVVAPFWLGPEALGRLGGDVLASLVYAVNWRFLSGDYAYALIFSRPSMVQHYWSLAIEAQLYVVLPLLVAAAARWRDPRSAFALMAALGIAAGTLAAFLLGADSAGFDRVYYGTDTRAPELLVGALLAAGFGGSRRAATPTASRALDVFSWGLLGVVLVAFSRVELSNEVLHRGGFTLFAVLSACLVAACVRGGSLGRALSWRPLVWVGEVSYGVYLFHWPVYLVLDAWLVGAEPWVKFLVGGAISVAAAWGSSVVIETPIRRGRGWPGRAPVAGLALAMILVTGAVGLRMPVNTVIEELRWRATGEEVAEEDGPDVPRIAVYGDSVALTLSGPLHEWLESREDARWVLGWSPSGCGLLMPDFVRRLDAAGGDIGPFTGRQLGLATRLRCTKVPDMIKRRVWRQRPDLAISVSSMWDMPGLPNAKTHAAERIGHQNTDERLRELMDARVRLLSGGGADVVWLTLPAFEPPANLEMSREEVEAARTRYNELVWELGIRHPERVHVIDLDEVLKSWPGGVFDPLLREDGIHFARDPTVQLLDLGLGDQIVELASRSRQRRDREAGSKAP